MPLVSLAPRALRDPPDLKAFRVSLDQPAPLEPQGSPDPPAPRVLLELLAPPARPVLKAFRASLALLALLALLAPLGHRAFKVSPDPRVQPVLPASLVPRVPQVQPELA